MTLCGRLTTAGIQLVPKQKFSRKACTDLVIEIRYVAQDHYQAICLISTDVTVIKRCGQCYHAFVCHIVSHTHIQTVETRTRTQTDTIVLCGETVNTFANNEPALIKGGNTERHR